MSRHLETISRVAMSILVVLVAMSLAFAAWTLTRPDPFDPLAYPLQRVVTIDAAGVESIPFVPGFGDTPAVALSGGIVPVSGQACSMAPDPVEAIGTMWWESLDPAGQRVLVLDDFPTVVDPGCVTFHIDNEIPVELDGMTEPQQWRITGSITPTAPGGVKTTFTTETFWVVP